MGNLYGNVNLPRKEKDPYNDNGWTKGKIDYVTAVISKYTGNMPSSSYNHDYFSKIVKALSSLKEQYSNLPEVSKSNASFDDLFHWHPEGLHKDKLRKCFNNLGSSSMLKKHFIERLHYQASISMWFTVKNVLIKSPRPKVYNTAFYMSPEGFISPFTSELL